MAEWITQTSTPPPFSLEAILVMVIALLLLQSKFSEDHDHMFSIPGGMGILIMVIVFFPTSSHFWLECRLCLVARFLNSEKSSCP